MKVVGIDPGVDGAIAMFDGTHLFVEDIPNMDVKVAKKMKTVLNFAALSDIFNFTFAGADHAYIELVSAMPKQGVTSSFNFGKTAGCLEMAVCMIGMPYTLVSPIKWKSELGLNSSGDRSRQRANQLFPSYAHFFKRVKDHNRAEAALLAWYGYQMLVNKGVRNVVKPI